MIKINLLAERKQAKAKSSSSVKVEGMGSRIESVGAVPELDPSVAAAMAEHGLDPHEPLRRGERVGLLLAGGLTPLAASNRNQRNQEHPHPGIHASLADRYTG